MRVFGSQRGVTLTELLVAMMLTTVGLFGLVAMYENVTTTWSVAADRMLLTQEAHYALSYVRDYCLLGYAADIKNREGRHDNELLVFAQERDYRRGTYSPITATVYQHVDEGTLMLREFDGHVRTLIPSYIPAQGGYDMMTDSSRAWVDTLIFTDIRPTQGRDPEHVGITLILENLRGDRVKMEGAIMFINAQE